MAIQKWVPLPSTWIEEHGLKKFQWKYGGSDNTAALMALVVIAHYVDSETGLAKITYDQLCTATDVSRAKLSRGLSILEKRGIVRRWQNGRSSFELVGYDLTSGWCKLPAKPLYVGPVVEAFRYFRLRSKAELNAIKLYLLFAARRGRDTNLANISFDKINEYSGIRRDEIKAATSLLASLSLVYIERVPSASNDYGVANAYRLAGLETSVHMGTRGRQFDAAEFEFPSE
ncbi:hypothetical protein [Paracoccus salsus]|uniref:hypothetical protein n=1 Tax=Paracoccus salsus TaxID=2911061 RepID=UPI001F1593AD|nr:hypothetical protein [Paracoccus salsus]MCF3972100.1 hypothetical protein [Paracoccus salsus]